jgi:hypothetical protein
MADSRFYVVTQSDNTRRLVEATNAAQATKYAAKKWIISVAAASARDVAELLGAGVTIEKAGEA